MVFTRRTKRGPSDGSSCSGMTAELVGLLELQQRIQEGLCAGKFGDCLRRGFVSYPCRSAGSDAQGAGSPTAGISPGALFAASKSRFVAMLPQTRRLVWTIFGKMAIVGKAIPVDGHASAATFPGRKPLAGYGGFAGPSADWAAS